MQDPLSPAERRMLQVLDCSWLVPSVVKNAVRHECAQGNSGAALGLLALWQVAFYGATTLPILAMVRLCVRPPSPCARFRIAPDNAGPELALNHLWQGHLNMDRRPG